MAGSVTRRKVWKREAPSVQAASSWSVPTSRSTGITSRTTNGSVTKIVASTIPGVEKMISIPFSVSQPPNQPSWPYTRISARPTTTGESASGSPIMVLISQVPCFGGRRTSAIAQATPKIVLAGTAIPTAIRVSLKAETNAGSVSASQTGVRPSRNV